MPSYLRDSETYSMCSQPFEDRASAQTAIDDFYADLCELRKKHKITDMIVVPHVTYVCVSGNERIIGSLWVPLWRGRLTTVYNLLIQSSALLLVQLEDLFLQNRP